MHVITRLRVGNEHLKTPVTHKPGRPDPALTLTTSVPDEVLIVTGVFNVHY